MQCCPLVVDYLTFVSLMAFIGLATYFFNEFIAMSMLAKKKKRRKRNVNIHSIVFAEGISLKLSQNKKSLNEVTVALFLVCFSQLLAKKTPKTGQL